MVSMNRKQSRGFSVIELMIAAALTTVVFSGIVVVVSGGQVAALDTSFSREASARVGTNFEKNVASVVESWDAAVLTDEGDTIYTHSTLPPIPISPCLKAIQGDVSWTSDKTRGFTTSLMTFVANVDAVDLYGDDCDTTTIGGFDNPHSPASFNITGQSGATDIDAYGDFLYLTTYVTPEAKEDFFIFEFDGAALSGPDPDDAFIPRGVLNVTEGVHRLDVAKVPSDGGTYAFLAGASNESDASDTELIVVDVADPDDPQMVGHANLGITPDCPGDECPGGALSIFYYDEKVYIGTNQINGPEFYVYDVSSPTSPSSLGSIEIGHTINDIYVAGDYAYLATDDQSGELMVIDVSVPAAMLHPDATGMKFDLTGTQDGTALFYSSGIVYLGVGRSAGDSAAWHDFYALNVSNPSTISEMGSKDVGLQNNSEVVGVVVKESYAFLALDDPTTGLQVLNISNPFDIIDQSVCTSFNFSENTSGIDVNGSFIFTANSSNAEIRLIEDQPTTCS